MKTLMRKIKLWFVEIPTALLRVAYSAGLCLFWGTACVVVRVALALSGLFKRDHKI